MCLSNNTLSLLMVAFIAFAAHSVYGQVNSPPPVIPPNSVATPSVTPAVVPGKIDDTKPAAAAAKTANIVPTSIFFTPEDQERIRAALIAYEESKKVKATDGENKANDFLNQLTGGGDKKEETKEQKTFIYPQFFLNSLVYHTPTDWVVLINNQRFIPQATQDNAELKITAVDNEKVALEWKPKRLDKVQDSWAKGANSEVGFDRVTGIVTFTLRPNQTFSSYAMRVVEGRLIPYAITIKTDEPTQVDVDDIISKEPKNPEAKKNENITTDELKNDVGVKALDKTYKRIGLGD